MLSIYFACFPASCTGPAPWVNTGAPGVRQAQLHMLGCPVTSATASQRPASESKATSNGLFIAGWQTAPLTYGSLRLHPLNSDILGVSPFIWTVIYLLPQLTSLSPFSSFRVSSASKGPLSSGPPSFPLFFPLPLSFPPPSPLALSHSLFPYLLVLSSLLPSSQHFVFLGLRSHYLFKTQFPFPCPGICPLPWDKILRAIVLFATIIYWFLLF